MKSSQVPLYASVGPELRRYTLDTASGALVFDAALLLPEGVQYAWPSPSGEFLYLVCSNGKPGFEGDRHQACVVRIDTASGRMALHGAAVPLARRPIHVTLDPAATHLVVTYPYPSGLVVHAIGPDGTIAGVVPQAADLDLGIVGHQFRFSPRGDVAVLVTRGNSAAGGKPEDPGALKSFAYADGALGNRGSAAPNGGYGFGPRHIDFHASGRWLYAALERQNQMWVFGLHDGVIGGEPLFRRPMLERSGASVPRQLVGTVHMHPNGRTVYAVNRADGVVDFNGEKVFNDGENSIVVFGIDQDSGEPTLLQHADTHGIHSRTFQIDPSGQWLVSANMKRARVRQGGAVIDVPASLALFRIGDDGRLAFQHRHEVDVGANTMFWIGFGAAQPVA